MVKRADESHRCEVNTLGILACNFSMSSKASQRNSFQKIAYRINLQKAKRFLPEQKCDKDSSLNSIIFPIIYITIILEM